MKVTSPGFSAAKLSAAVALTIFVGWLGVGAAHADLATPAQKRACTPDVYRLCAGEIPNVKAIVACLRRQKGSLSEGCRAVFDQKGE